MGASSAGDPGMLKRRLGVFDAVMVGLGSMVGAGIFVALAPPPPQPDPGSCSGWHLAAVVAYCNATSSARLAARYPQSGGTYVYGRERLGECGVTWPVGPSWSARSRPVRRWR